MDELLIAAAAAALLLFRKKSPPPPSSSEAGPDDLFGEEDVVWEEDLSVEEDVALPPTPEQSEAPITLLKPIPVLGPGIQQMSREMATYMHSVDEVIALVAGRTDGSMPESTRNATLEFFRRQYMKGVRYTDSQKYRWTENIAAYAKSLREFAELFPVPQPVREGTLLRTEDLRTLQVPPQDASALAQALNYVMEALDWERSQIRTSLQNTGVFTASPVDSLVMSEPSLFGVQGAHWKATSSLLKNVSGWWSTPESVGTLTGTAPGMRPYVKWGTPDNLDSWCTVPRGWSFTTQTNPKRLVGTNGIVSAVGAYPPSDPIHGRYNDCLRRGQIVLHYLCTRGELPEIAALFSGRDTRGVLRQGYMNPWLGVSRLTDTGMPGTGAPTGRPTPTGRRRLRALLAALVAGRQDLDIVRVVDGRP